MTTQSSALRKASARIEALEQRSLFSGEIDHSFGTGGLTGVYDKTGWNVDVNANVMAIQPDGKIVVVGSSHDSYKNATVVRYLANGTLDTTFGDGGFSKINNVNANRIDGIGVLSNGKIQITGQTEIRLTAAGKLDTTFSGDGLAASYLAGDRRGTSIVFPDGTFLELGHNATGGQDRLFKYKADGSVDSAFATGGAFNLGTLGSTVSGGVTTDSAGRIYVSYKGKAGDLHVVRLTTAGKIDTNWGMKGIANGDGGSTGTVTSAITVLKDGRVLVGYHRASAPTQSTVDVFNAAGFEMQQRNFVVQEQFDIRQILQAADGTIYLGGTYNDGRSGAHLPATNYIPLTNKAALIRLNSDLSRNYNYSADADGVAGYSAYEGDLSFAAARLTSSGDVVVASKGGNDLYLARITGASKPMSVSYTQSPAGDAFTVTGSAGDDSIHIGTFIGSGPNYDIVVDFDTRRAITSEDRLIIGNQNTPKITVNLNGGNDKLDAGDSGVILSVDGGTGNDEIICSRNQNPSVHGGDGKDTITAGYGFDTLYGDGGDDVIYGGFYLSGSQLDGGAGNDYLYARGGHSIVLGGDGNDHLFHYGYDNASVNATTLNGGNGLDTANYSQGDTLISIEKAILGI